MATSNFKRAEVVAGSTRTSIYGPVPVGMVGIVFAGTFSNTDSVNGADHTVTLEVLNSVGAYIPRLFRIPVPYGGSSKCPKTVLLAGESLIVTADVPNVIQASVDILERI